MSVGFFVRVLCLVVVCVVLLVFGVGYCCLGVQDGRCRMAFGVVRWIQGLVGVMVRARGEFCLSFRVMPCLLWG